MENTIEQAKHTKVKFQKKEDFVNKLCEYTNMTRDLTIGLIRSGDIVKIKCDTYKKFLEKYSDKLIYQENLFK